MNQRQQVDCIIAAGWVLPIVPRGKILADCAIAVQAGCIEAISTRQDILQRFETEQVFELPDHVLMPGLVNAHGHAAMSLLRGYADDLPLMGWLQQHIWPAESQWMSEDFVRDGSALAALEMIRTGTTCFSDTYYFPEVSAEVARESGLRAQINFPVLDFPSIWAQSADEYIHKGLSLHDDYRSVERITVGFGPHSAYTVSDAPLKRLAVLADEVQAPIHIHLHETATEITDSLREHGVRPIDRLHSLGVITPQTQCVHMTQVAASDIERLQTTGASVVHCPESNLKLASGICPVQTLLDADIRVALGTDGAASNNDLDMFGELATAALIGKHAANNAAALNAHRVLEMATLGGAQVLCQDRCIGSLEPGKRADVIAVRIDDVNLLPRYDVASVLVYNNRHIRVTHSWVDGKLLMDDTRVLSLNAADLANRARHWQRKLAP